MTATTVARLAAAKLTVWCGLTLIAFMYTTTHAAQVSTLDDGDNLGRPHAAGSPTALIAERDCWVGEGPAGVVPGHVVVTKPGRVAPTYGGARLTGMALQQVFEGVDHGLRVHGFCQ